MKILTITIFLFSFSFTLNTSSSEMEIDSKLLSNSQKTSNNDQLKKMSEIISKNATTTKTTLSKLLSQLTLQPIKDKPSGHQLFKVIKVEKGSIWEKEGIKAGDLVAQ